MKSRSVRRTRQLECLESRCCLSSVGWDGPGQGSADLTYYIGKAPSSLDQATVEATIERALAAWSDVVDVDFTQTSTAGQRDSLDFTFGRIDGAGGTLAQAYLPDDVNSARIAGDVQFDSSETWEVGNSQGSRAFDLLLVAVHEIGHALGLEHSFASASVMGSTVSPTQSFTKLASTDVDAALALYAAADSGTTTSDTPTPSDPTSGGGTTNEQPTSPTGGTDHRVPSAPDTTPTAKPWFRWFGPQPTHRRFWFSWQFTTGRARSAAVASAALAPVSWNRFVS